MSPSDPGKELFTWQTRTSFSHRILIECPDYLLYSIIQFGHSVNVLSLSFSASQSIQRIFESIAINLSISAWPIQWKDCAALLFKRRTSFRHQSVLFNNSMQCEDLAAGFLLFAFYLCFFGISVFERKQINLDQKKRNSWSCRFLRRFDASRIDKVTRRLTKTVRHSRREPYRVWSLPNGSLLRSLR